MSEFQVHGDALAKKPRRPRKGRADDLEVTRVPREAIMLAHDLARGRDVHIKLGTGNERGVVYILNGAK